MSHVVTLMMYIFCILQQMMQQQAALMAAAQGTYLNPMAAIAAAQMQQMATFNVNGLVAAPMTPSSGTPCLSRPSDSLTLYFSTASGKCRGKRDKATVARMSEK